MRRILLGGVLLAGLLIVSCMTSDVRRGEQLAALGDWDGAVAAYREALKKDPHDSAIQQRLDYAKTVAAEQHYREGRQHLQNNRLPEALHEFKLALGLNLARQHQELARQQQEQAEQQARQQKEQAAQQARQQMAQYRFLGYLTQRGEQQAFLGKGQAIFIVRVGDTVEGKIQVAAIDASEVKLRETSTNTETTIPLTKPAGSL